jgi:hypothetical protein
MRTQLLIAIASLMVCGVASAQGDLPTIEVRAGTLESMQVSCAKPDTVSAKDVERVLSITDPTTTPMLRRRLIHAASAACKAGIPHILVTAGPHDTLTWKRVD